MLRGLWKLTWIEIKIFLREPLGAFGTIGVPVLLFLVLGRILGRKMPSMAAGDFVRVGLPVFASVLIALSAVLSLVTIISIYREGGILKRLRATPLRPQTILTAHVIVKLTLTAATLMLDGAGGEALLPDWASCSFVLIHDRTVDRHLEHLVDWLSHRQHCSHCPLCAADRRRHSIPDDRHLGAVYSH